MRTIEYQGERLFYHQVGGGKYASWSSPKRVRCDDDGTLWPGSFPGLESHHTADIINSLDDMGEFNRRDPGLWQRRGEWIIAESMVAGSALRIAEDMAHYHLQFTVRLGTARCAGVVLRAEGFERGAHVLLDADQGHVQIGSASDYDGHSGPVKRPTVGWTLKMFDSFKCPIHRDRAYHVRCFVRNEHLEVYLDDRWVFSTVFGDNPMPDRGAIELTIEAGQAEFGDVRLNEIEAMG